MATGKRNGEDVPFPVRGVPGGWCDVWDEPDDLAQLHRQAAIEALWEAVGTQARTDERAEHRQWQRARGRELGRRRRSPIARSGSLG